MASGRATKSALELSLNAVTGVAALAVIFAVGVSLNDRFQGKSNDTRAESRTRFGSLNDVAITVEPTAKSEGTGDVVMVEYADFECTFCGVYARGAYVQLRRDFVEPGHITYVFRHFPLDSAHDIAFPVAEAAECAAEQQRFWPVHDWLFANQPKADVRSLVENAEVVGLDREQFRSCSENNSQKKRVLDERSEGLEIGVKGTPTFVFGTLLADRKTVRLTSILRGSAPFSTIAAHLNDLLRTK